MPKLGEECPKVRLSQDSMPILSSHLTYSEGKGTKLSEGEILVWDYYVCEGLLHSGLLHLGQLRSARVTECL